MGSRQSEARIEEELPLLADLVAEGLDLGLEPRGLLRRLAIGMRPGPLQDRVQAVLRDTELGQPLRDALNVAAGAAGSRAFALFARCLADCGAGPGSGHVLRFQAREMRQARHYRQAMQVQRMPFHLLLALVFLIAPLTYGLLVLPFVARTAAVLRR